MTNDTIARLKITLADVSPRVLRLIEVPFGIRLDRLHETLQATFGWTNSHLWGFEAGGANFGPRSPVDFAFGDPVLDARKVTLAELIEDTGAKDFFYIYDYGDYWEHVIQIERLLDVDPAAHYPRLLKAESARPPEDIGGPPGYEEFLAAINDPEHERYAEFAEWFGENRFDASTVEAEMINAELARLSKRWNRKPAKRKAMPA